MTTTTITIPSATTQRHAFRVIPDPPSSRIDAIISLVIETDLSCKLTVMDIQGEMRVIEFDQNGYFTSFSQSDKV